MLAKRRINKVDNLFGDQEKKAWTSQIFNIVVISINKVTRYYLLLFEKK